MSQPTVAPGLRERSKARRRREILLAALRLFAVRGYESATIQDIADAAQVAPRTVTGYFPSKLDLLIEWPTLRSRRILELYRTRPRIGFLELVDLWWHEARDNIDPEIATLARAVAIANPGVTAMAEAEVVRRASADSEATGPRPRTDEPILTSAGRAAIAAVNQTFFRALAEGRMDDHAHASLLALIEAIMRETGAGHGSLAPVGDTQRDL